MITFKIGDKIKNKEGKEGIVLRDYPTGKKNHLLYIDYPEAKIYEYKKDCKKRFIK